MLEEISITSDMQMIPPLWQKAKKNNGLEEAQAGIKLAGRNIDNLRYTDDTCLWQKVKN